MSSLHGDVEKLIKGMDLEPEKGKQLGEDCMKLVEIVYQAPICCQYPADILSAAILQLSK
jgi:hypothetical protein